MRTTKPIDLSAVTSKEMNKIRNGLALYTQIQNDIRDTPSFREVFAKFYFVPKTSITLNDQELFFNKMFANHPSDPLDFAKSLKDDGAQKFFLSFATKAVHTFNNDSPIYDSVVVSYLHQQRNAHMSYTDAISNWIKLKDWYETFLQTEEADEWVAWFDNNFPSYTWISKVKKIDFIIYSFAAVRKK